QAAAGFRSGFALREREKLLIAVRRPGERVDAKEAERMINAVEVKHLPNVADAGAPPIEIPSAQFVPAVNRDAPILSPLFGKGIHFENFFRRRAPAPIEVEDGAIGPNVRAVPANAERNVAHEKDLLRRAISADRLPM